MIAEKSTGKPTNSGNGTTKRSRVAAQDTRTNRTETVPDIPQTELNLREITKRSEVAWSEAEPEVVALDTETTGFSWYDDAFCVTAAWETGGGVQTHYFELEHIVWLPELIRETPTWVFHNAKFDLQKLIRAGILDRDRLFSERLEDTECLYHLRKPYSEDKGLKAVAKELLGVETDEAEAVAAACRKLKLRKKDPGFGYHLLPREVVYPYSLKDAEFTLGVWQVLRPALPDDLYPLYRKEMDLTLVLLDMEAAGMGVDMDYVSKALKSENGEILRVEHTIQEITGKKVWYPEKQGQKTPDGCLNPGSWQQLLAAFAERGIEISSTKAEVLERIDDPLAHSIIELRDHKKIRDYFAQIKAETQDGVIHPNARQHQPKTGRLSSAKEKG